MASILEYLLQGEVSPDNVVKWLKDESETSNRLKGLESLKQEFIPFFLNYLRDHTIHLVQSSKSATPSPAKAPSLKKQQKSTRRESGSKRQQLFGCSPGGDAQDDLKDLSSSVFSPNTSLDSPNAVSSWGDSSNFHGNAKQRNNGHKKSPHSAQSPQCGSQKSYSAPDQRSRQKLSLGEFLATPDRNNNGSPAWRKSTPGSGNRKDSLGDLSPSPSFGHGRRSGGKKKHSLSPLVQNENKENYSWCSTPKQVFNLNSTDFPPMSTEKPPNDPVKFSSRRSIPDHKSDSVCDGVLSKSLDGLKASREIDFSSPSPVVMSDSQENNTKGNSKVSPEMSSKSARRVTPTLIKGGNTVPQNTAFLAAIEESGAGSKSHSKHSLSGDRKTDQRANELECTRKETWSADGAGSTALVTPKKSAFEHSISQTDEVEASLGEVTHQDKLDVLVSLYSRCLDDNLLPNLVVELYFLMQLLTARSSEEDSTTQKTGTDVVEENYFRTVHNTVYFAVCVMDQQKRLLVILDRATLRLLCENQRIAVFSSLLQVHLEDLYDKSEIKRGPTYLRSPIACVSFQADTDNKKSFPTEKCFHLFKRQRDCFYELIREWEASHMTPEYNMEEMFGARVRTIISPNTHLANHIHFARLFQSQLLAMNKGEVSVPVPDEDENTSLLSQLKRTNPEKFKRLQERFIKPLSLGGPCPPPAFPGCQEFFRDFIVTASNPILNQHLSDTFAAKILEINEMCMGCHDDDDTEGANDDEEGRELYCSMLMNMKLLAKFLGFVTFLPYQSPDRIPVAMETDYVTLRNKQVPPIDMYECIHIAGETGYLMFTVPWVVEFLSMMDSMASRIDHYQKILYILLHIHRYSWSRLREELVYSRLIIVCVISWLLENPVVPDGFFFMEIPEEIQHKVVDCLPFNTSVDNCCSIDQTIFYTCCPYIGEMKTLLVDFAVGSSSKALSTRKITPVTTGSLTDKSVTGSLTEKSVTDRQIQLQLEENFFHNHPSSLKRVVVFVADRTASNYIKKFRATQLQETCVEGKNRVRDILMGQWEELMSDKLKDKTSAVVNQVVQDQLIKVKAIVKAEAPRYFEERISPLLVMLLPDDQSPVVINMAVLISSRIAREKVLSWINKHVTSALLKTEVSVEVEKICKTLTNNDKIVLNTKEPTLKPESTCEQTPLHGSRSMFEHKNEQTKSQVTQPENRPKDCDSELPDSSCEDETLTQSADVATVTQSGDTKAVTQSADTKAVTQCTDTKVLTLCGNTKAVAQSVDTKAVTQSGVTNTVIQSFDIKTVTQSVNTQTLTESADTTTVTQSDSDKSQSMTVVGDSVVKEAANDSVTQSAKDQTSGHVAAEVHCDLLKHPSEVLLDLKDFVKAISLKNHKVTVDVVQEQLMVVKETLEHRQDVIPSVHRSFVQLTMDLLITLLVSHPHQYTQAVIDNCLQLWTTILRDSALKTIFSGRVVYTIHTASNRQAAWLRYTELLIMLHQQGIVKVTDAQEAALVFIPYIKDQEMLLQLCQCLCRLAELIPVESRAESFGACLEMLYNCLPLEDCDEAVTILQMLSG